MGFSLFFLQGTALESLSFKVVKESSDAEQTADGLDYFFPGPDGWMSFIRFTGLGQSEPDFLIDVGAPSIKSSYNLFSFENLAKEAAEYKDKFLYDKAILKINQTLAVDDLAKLTYMKQISSTNYGSVYFVDDTIVVSLLASAK